MLGPSLNACSGSGCVSRKTPWAPAGPVEQPLARWRPAEDGPPELLPVEVYDPFTRRFEPLPRPEASP